MRLRASIPLLLFLCYSLAESSLAAPQPQSSLRLVFLRQGTIWSALPDGSDQRQAIAAASPILRYALAPTGDAVAVSRRIGDLDTLELRHLSTDSIALIRAGDGYIDQFAWSHDDPPVLGYVYRSTAPDDPPQLILADPTGGDPHPRYKCAAGERVLQLYPAPKGLVLITKDAAGLNWSRCTLDGTVPLEGYPGKTITSMPLDGSHWLTSLYAPGTGRSLAILTAADPGMTTQAAIDLPRANLDWSVAPLFRNDLGEPLKVVIREDQFGLSGGPNTSIVIWDLVNQKLQRVPLKSQALISPPVAEPTGKRLVICTQFQDGSGYGTPPCLWAFTWHGERGPLLVSDATDPQWWLDISPPVVEPVTPPTSEPETDQPTDVPEPAPAPTEPSSPEGRTPSS